MSVADDVAGAIEARALWHLMKAREPPDDEAADHERGQAFLIAFAEYVRDLPDNDGRLVDLELLHFELPPPSTSTDRRRERRCGTRNTTSTPANSVSSSR